MKIISSIDSKTHCVIWWDISVQQYQQLFVKITDQNPNFFSKPGGAALKNGGKL